ncbi:MAG: nucleotidyltransferase domain-containing protein [Candidatus Helarchaeota archaeon]
MNSRSFDEIREILNPLNQQFEVILFGSILKAEMRPNSDIDIAVISRKQDKAINIKLQIELLGLFPLKYDIRVFELFPIYIQITIVQDYYVLFGDPLEISEYFYGVRKKWDDCKYRILSNQFSSYRERLALINHSSKIF